jgi:8-oxo-dGTP pyrophosphatase MutT (NUDIX family)
VTRDYPPGDTSPIIRRLSEKIAYSNRFATIYDDPVVFPDGSEGSYLRIVETGGKPGVAMLPVCGGQVALVLTYRYALGSWEWAMPRGFAHGDDPSSSARAELVEELGREPDDLIPIGTVTPNSGLLAGRVNLFLARYATTVAEPTDRNEIADVKWISTKELQDEIASGQIADAFTLSAVTCAQARGLVSLI